MKVFGLAGWSGAGKTTLMVALLPHLIGQGVRVSTLKHAHHEFDIDKPGKDSFRHRQAGAVEVMVASSRRWALMHELREGREPTLAELAARMAPVDLLLVEGFKNDPIDKLEVHRPSLGKPALWPHDPSILAVASDVPLPGLRLPRLELADAAGVARFILARTGLSR